MKTRVLFFLSFLIISGTAFSQKNSKNSVSKKDIYISCFSSSNFDRVHKYIVELINKEKIPFITRNGYCLTADEPNTIKIEKDDWTVGFISKEKGIISTVKTANGNKKTKKDINGIYCDLLFKSQAK